MVAHSDTAGQKERFPKLGLTLTTSFLVTLLAPFDSAGVGCSENDLVENASEGTANACYVFTFGKLSARSLDVIWSIFTEVFKA
jgi:hypothetical protein